MSWNESDANESAVSIDVHDLARTLLAGLEDNARQPSVENVKEPAMVGHQCKGVVGVN